MNAGIMDGVSIRAAQACDRQAIAQVLVASYAQFAPRLDEHWPQMRTVLERAADTTYHRFLLATEGDSVSGVIAYYPPGEADKPVFETGWASVRLLGVAPQFARRGVGRLLMQHCIACARQQRASHLALYTSELMTDAQAMYRSLGFALVKPLPTVYDIRYWLFTLPLETAVSEQAS